jgi:hypothetical protein
MRRSFVVTVVLAALAVVTLAPAKEGARARLTTRLPLGASSGTTIRAQWTVEVRDDNGRRRPFGASFMFVRLLSRTGAASTRGFADTDADGRNTAAVEVPVGGIGGVRIGLRGTTDIFFPLENDPFMSPGGVRCDVAALRSTLMSFIRAYNGGDLRRLDRLVSREQFLWYSAIGPSRSLRGAKQNRETLIPYFRERHRRGDRVKLSTYRFNGYDRARNLGHFELHGERRAADMGDGRWLRMTAKGALDCSKPPVTIAVMSVGGDMG